MRLMHFFSTTYAGGQLISKLNTIERLSSALYLRLQSFIKDLKQKVILRQVQRRLKIIDFIDYEKIDKNR